MATATRITPSKPKPPPPPLWDRPDAPTVTLTLDANEAEAVRWALQVQQLTPHEANKVSGLTAGSLKGAGARVYTALSALSKGPF